MITREGAFGMAGYLYVMNRNRDEIANKREALLTQYRWLNDFLLRHNPGGTWLFDEFGLAEVVFTPYAASTPH
jgi:glutathione S-transferase